MAATPTTQEMTLLLRAQDDASKAIASVAAELQKLGSGTSLAGLEGQLGAIGTAIDSAAQHVPALTDAVKEGMAASVEATKAGATEIVEALKVGLAEETNALKEALAAQVEARKEAAREGAEGEKGGFLGGLGEKLEKPIEFAKVFIGWEAGMAALSAITEGVHELPKAFMEAADEGDQFTAQMANFYGGLEQGRQVMEYTNAEAMKLPFSLAQIQQATASLAEAGQNVPEALPALGNIAAAYHTNLTDVIDAANRAIATGSTRGLESYLHMTKQQLAAAGVEWDKQGHLIASSVLPALEAIGNTRFGDAMARQGATAQSGLQRIANAFDLFKEAAGEGLAKGLAGPLKTVTDWLQTHQATVQRWGQAVGDAMAKAGAAAIWLAEKLGPPISAAIGIVVAAWNAAQPPISAAIGVITAATGQVGAFLRDQVAPVVFQVLGQMAGWWDAHAKQIGQILQVIWGAFQTFWGSLQANMESAFNEMHGIWEVGWGLVSGVVGAFIDLVTGNWRQFGEDLKNMAGSIAMGVVDIFAGMVERAIGIVAHLEDPITQLSQAFFSLSSSWAGAIYDAFISVQQTVTGIINDVIGSIDTAITKIDQTFQSKTLTIRGHKVLTTPGLDIGTITPLAMPQAGPADRTTFMQAFGLGKQITFGATGDQALAAVEKTRTGIDAEIRKYLGMPSAQQEGKAGQTLWDSITGLFGKYKAQSLGLPAGDQAALGGLPALVSGAGSGAGAAADPTQALRSAYDAATKHLQADIEHGISTNVLMADRDKIRQTMLQEQKAGLVNVDDIFLEMNSTLKSIQDAVHQKAQTALQSAQQTLGWEQTLQMPYKVLKGQVDTIMKDLVGTGVAPGSLQYKATYKQLMDQISAGGAATAQAATAPTARYGSYSGMAGYGQTTVSFGGPAQTNHDAEIIAELRQQNAQLRQQLQHDEQLLAAAQNTARNTAQSNQLERTLVDTLGRALAPGLPRGVPNAGAVLRGAGLHAPVKS